MAAISLRGKVFDKIREDILKGRYKKGDELVECTIGKELGVSRTPVREAIRQLELEGLVQLIPNKGAFVTGISSKDVMDMYQIRAKLEGLCAAMALPKNSWKKWKRRYIYQISTQTRAITNRSASRTAGFISFYIRHQEAGFWRIPFPIFTNICRESEWLL